MQDIIKKADVLIEALPYIRKFKGSIVVIKAGGSIMENRSIIGGIFEDIIFLSSVGIKPVLIHGGGPRISAKMKDAGLQPVFIDGLRVTDAQTIRIVETMLDETNRDIAEHIEQLGGKAKALCGKENKIIKAQKLRHKGRDIGFVGKISSINTAAIKKVLASEAIPVVTPLGLGVDGKTYNINADLAACSIASALKAEKFILITDTKGILMEESNEETLISTLRRKEVPNLIGRGVIKSGMIPKVRAAVAALNGGVKKTHIIDGRLEHAVLLEIFTDRGIGTEIIR